MLITAQSQLRASSSWDKPNIISMGAHLQKRKRKGKQDKAKIPAIKGRCAEFGTLICGSGM
jgi:hypothetical protein